MKIEVSNLSKKFGNRIVVDDLSFEVEEGEILGFLGPNGAGKSTTMKMLTGFLEPSIGKVSICGHDITTDAIAAKKIIGYLPEGAPTYGEMSVVEFLGFIVSVRGLQHEKTERIANVVEKLELQSVLNQPIDTLSKGFKRRVGLAQALIHEPKVLIMDEPTDGLDPNQKHQVRELITALTEDKIVIISTHILEEVTAVCSRVLIISDGHLLVNETPEKLLSRSRYHNAVSFRINNDDAIKQIQNLQEVSSVENSNDGRTIIIPSGVTPLYPLLNSLNKSNSWNIQDMRLETGKLDEVFRMITAGAMI